MGGKGRKRREKNYKSAHGGFSRLPPPPVASQVDALPSKLRNLISFTSSRFQGSEQVSKGFQKKQKREDDGNEKKAPLNRKTELRSSEITGRDNDENLKSSQLIDDTADNTAQNEKKGKRKRKRNEVKDLRFDALMETSDRHAKKHERMKKYFGKKKEKKTKPEMNVDFPKREHIAFGEVVEAPPKLVTVPRASKISQDASQQRIRLRAIEAYRNRKGWASRPGIQLPLTML